MSEAKNNAKNVIDDKEIIKKVSFINGKVKEVLSNPIAQTALKQLIDVPESVVIKKVNKKSTEHHSQKVEAMFGTTIENAVSIKFTIDTEDDSQFLDPVNSMGKRYRIVDYNIGLDANMSGKDFLGYSAVGFKLIVTKIEGV